MNTPFPDWFDELAQLEAEAKGVLSDFPLIINGRETRFTFLWGGVSFVTE